MNEIHWAHTLYLYLFTVFNKSLSSSLYSHFLHFTQFTSLVTPAPLQHAVHPHFTVTSCCKSHSRQRAITIIRLFIALYATLCICPVIYLRTFRKHLSLSFPFKKGLATGCMTSDIIKVIKVCGTADLPGNDATLLHYIL
jgi:hypothetical protein